MVVLKKVFLPTICSYMNELIFIVVVFIYEWKNVRLPGIEPGLEAWEAPVIAAGPQPHFDFCIIVQSSRRRDGRALQRRDSGRSGPQPHVWISVNFAIILGQAIYHLWFMDGK